MLIFDTESISACVIGIKCLPQHVALGYVLMCSWKADVSKKTETARLLSHETEYTSKGRKDKRKAIRWGKVLGNDLITLECCNNTV